MIAWTTYVVLSFCSYNDAIMTSIVSSCIEVYGNTFGTIYSIIDHLKKSSDQKDILELFKLYAISEDWLKP